MAGQAPGARRRSVLPVRCHDPTHAATQEAPGRYLRSAPGRLRRPENLGCSPQDPDDRVPVSDEKYLRDIKTQLTRLPDLDKYPGWETQ